MVDFEIEDAVLVGQFEGCAEEGRVGSVLDVDGGRREVDAVEGGEHGEFELEVVDGGHGVEGDVSVPGPFAYFDCVFLLWLAVLLLR